MCIHHDAFPGRSSLLDSFLFYLIDESSNLSINNHYLLPPVLIRGTIASKTFEKLAEKESPTFISIEFLITVATIQ